MTTSELTPAELALHLGLALPPDGGKARSALEAESLAEASWLVVPRVRYTHQHLVGAPDFHTYKLTQPMDAEDAYWNDVPLAEHTKYSISRHLERAHAWDRQRLWRRTLNELRTAVDLGVPPWDPELAPHARARGRGRGREAVAPGRAPGGRARGRGRARGGR